MAMARPSSFAAVLWAGFLAGACRKHFAGAVDRNVYGKDQHIGSIGVDLDTQDAGRDLKRRSTRNCPCAGLLATSSRAARLATSHRIGDPATLPN